MSSTKSNTMDRSKLIELKQRKLVKTRDHILALNDSISKIGDQLKEKKMSDKSERVARSRIITHNKANQLDGLKRPSDRGADIRAYTKMDLDIWKYHEVRDWFNKDAVPETPYVFRPSETGYTIRND